MSGHVLDLTRYAFKHVRGDLIVFGTWAFNEDKEDTEPALAIIPAGSLQGVRPALIGLSAAFRYLDAAYCARMAHAFALGFGRTSISDALKVGNLIHDHLGELVGMPPDPTEEYVAGEAKVTHGDGRIETLTLIDHIQLPQA